MNKICKIIIFSILVLALIATGCVFYIKSQESKMGPASFESFVRKEVDGKIYMENKDLGLSFIVPDEWEVRNAAWSSLSIASKDFRPLRNDNANIPLAENGCWIDITAEKEKVLEGYSNRVVSLISDINKGNKIDNEEVIRINGEDSLKTEEQIGVNNSGKHIYVEIPNDNIIYTFEVSILGENKSNCLDSFNNFLKDISIKKK